MNNTNFTSYVFVCVLGLIPSFRAFFVTTVTTFIDRYGLQAAVNNLRLCMGNKISSISDVK